MSDIEKIIHDMRNNQNNVKFSNLVKVCNHYFGEPRQNGTSHKVYKMPWVGDPRVNIQNSNNKAKNYQVKQVLKILIN